MLPNWQVLDPLGSYSISLLQHLPRVNSQPLSPEDSSTARARWACVHILCGMCSTGCCSFSYAKRHGPLCPRRLLSRLDMYGLCEVSVHGDGNCQVSIVRHAVLVQTRHFQHAGLLGFLIMIMMLYLCLQFRALSDQLYRTPDEHGYIRAAAIAQLRSLPAMYQDYIPENYQDYCYRMQQLGTWGDHVTLQAVADAFGVRIAIMTSYQDGCVVEIQPHSEVKSQRILYLSFWAEVSSQGVYT